MAAIKSYTDIEQSRKLAEILSIESADMYWYLAIKGNPRVAFNEGYNEYGDFELPCWSLAALLDIIRKTIGYTLYGVDNYVYMSCDIGNKPWKLETELYNNEVDACYQMIIRLNELNLL